MDTYQEKEGRRICFVHVGMQRHGAERVLAYLANKYAQQGYQTDILMLLSEESGYQLHPNVRTVSFVRSEKSRICNVWYWMRSIRRHVKKTNPAHVVSFSMYVNLFTLAACIGLGRDILISERDDPFEDGRPFAAVAASWILYGTANKIVFQTKRARSFFPAYIRKKSRILYNPVSVTCKAEDTGKKKIVNAARLEKQKNQELLIRAFHMTCSCRNDYELFLYGDGSLKNKLRELACQLGIREKVHFMGAVDDVHKAMQDAKIFVLSSDHEGMSNALLEAMMMGLPCISTACAGSDEIIKSYDNGVLVRTGDVYGLKRALLHLMSDDALCRRIGHNAQKTAAKFEKERVLRQWMEYIGQ